MNLEKIGTFYVEQRKSFNILPSTIPSPTIFNSIQPEMFGSLLLPIHSILRAIYFQTFHGNLLYYTFNPPMPAILLAIFYTVHSILPCSHMHSILLAIFFQFWPFAIQYIQLSLAAIFIQSFQPFSFNPSGHLLHSTFNPPMQPYSFYTLSHFPSILLALYYTVYSIPMQPYSFNPPSHFPSILLAICYTVHSIPHAAIFILYSQPFSLNLFGHVLCSTFNPPMQPYAFNPPSQFPSILLAIFYTVHSILPCSQIHSNLLAIFIHLYTVF